MTFFRDLLDQPTGRKTAQPALPFVYLPFLLKPALTRNLPRTLVTEKSCPGLADCLVPGHAMKPKLGHSSATSSALSKLR